MISFFKKKCFIIFEKLHLWRFERRNQLFSNKFQSCGKNLLVYGNPEIVFPHNIRIGENVCLNNGCVLNATSSFIEIGDNVTISSGASVLAATYDIKSFFVNHEKQHISKPVIIGNDVWICASAVICPGVHIAEKTIVAAGAVVTKDVLESGVIVAGNPACVVKRFDFTPKSETP